jgi:hypothetical protein
MPDEVFLRDKAREAIRSGKLPMKKPDRSFHGRAAALSARCVVMRHHVSRWR